MSARRPWVPLSVVLSVALPALLTMLLVQGAGDWRWVHEPVHSTVESAGGLIAIGMAALLIWRRQYPGHAAHFEWVATAFAMMGPLDLAHACVRVGPVFFWSRALPTLLGGLLIALVWFPSAWAERRAVHRFPLVAAAIALPICIALLAAPGAFPAAFSPTGDYTAWAKGLNVVGGLGFLTSAVFFLRRYWAIGATEDLVFANHCLLFASAGLLFGLSHLWDPVWWLFHLLRLLAYLVVLRFVVEVYRNLQRSQEEAIAAEVVEQTELVTARIRELEAALDEAKRR